MPAAKRGEESNMDGVALVVEVEGVEVLSRIAPPEPTLPPLPKRTTAKRRERVKVAPTANVIDATCEVVS